jgi:hypothetical protein
MVRSWGLTMTNSLDVRLKEGEGRKLSFLPSVVWLRLFLPLHFLEHIGERLVR